MMNRQFLRTTDEVLAAEFGRVLEMFGRALTSRADLPGFLRRINEAGAQGATWVEALERAANYKDKSS